jgi:hypothetical protein
MIRRRQRSEVVVSTQPGGVAVQGTRKSVVAFRDKVLAVARSTDLAEVGELLSTVASAIEQLPASGDGAAAYFEFSPRALELLQRHGAIPANGGFFRSMIHDGGQIAGNLDWKRVQPGPELLQLQTMAVGLALQASIQELTAAVERVEDKVDHLTDRIRSVQVGEIFAHHRVLAEYVDALEQGHPIGNTDWSSIDHLRAEIAANIDATRVLLRAPIARAEPGWSAASRASVSQRMLEDDFGETLGLLAVCEHNLASWHRIRIERVRATEPEHLERTLARVESDLALHRGEDQRLVDQLSDFVAQLAEPTGLEGLELWKRSQLSDNTAELQVLVDRFGEERVLDIDTDGRAELPTLLESLVEAKDRGVKVADRIWGSVRRKTGRSDTPELEAGSDDD